MVKDGDYVAIFKSVHRVMEAERLLKDRKLPILMIPAPRAIASDCGLGLRYGEEVRREVESALSEAGLLPKELFRKQGEEYLKIQEEP
ncbi:DUF3343 domain-containing protein [Geomesophilobacter sediminis]|uniref:DUF3343 domain-containing protein n=1 Tax=Geomesophilobacter sediminis TaxID=2798584 RepID=A0A8J7S9S1_9BACT|nr:DUF3343 domain-containing protein [Geomesophilobacter sediminis]MBJ6727041.1 DUF3343 domain-containing protein [Geomesophilobacter sediminis]